MNSADTYAPPELSEPAITRTRFGPIFVPRSVGDWTSRLGRNDDGYFTSILVKPCLGMTSASLTPSDTYQVESRRKANVTCSSPLKHIGAITIWWEIYAVAWVYRNTLHKPHFEARIGLPILAANWLLTLLSRIHYREESDGEERIHFE